MNENERNRDFPGGPVVKNLPSNGEDMGLIPGQWTKIPHDLTQGNLTQGPDLESLSPETPEARTPTTREAHTPN